ncbi:MAG: bifunctional heptose 7-phosphate kinase/heptose 1-phosphate adenyltransferase [Candidatus Acidiferrales bacterium]
MKISEARMMRLVKSFRGKRLAVAGDWMLDRYVWGTATKLSPEAAVPVVDFTNETSCPGGAGNVAANLVALGAKVQAFGVTGEDEAAESLRACARALGLSDKGLVTDRTRPTTVKTRIMARHQHVVRVDRESRASVAKEIEEILIRRVLAGLRQADALVISDYDKGAVTDEFAGRVLGVCKKLGVPAFVKPKWSRLPTYPGATAIVCNRGEAGFLVTRALDDEESVGEAGRALLAHFGCPAVVITRGEEGMNVFEHDAPKGFHVGATSREIPYGKLGAPGPHRGALGRQVFDLTGAGDTVLATLALASAAGASMKEVAILANVAAGIVVGKLGTATVSPQELLGALGEANVKAMAAGARG